MDVRIHDLLTRLATVSPQRIGATLGDDVRTFARARRRRQPGRAPADRRGGRTRRPGRLVGTDGARRARARLRDQQGGRARSRRSTRTSARPEADDALQTLTPAARRRAPRGRRRRARAVAEPLGLPVMVTAPGWHASASTARAAARRVRPKTSATSSSPAARPACRRARWSRTAPRGCAPSSTTSRPAPPAAAGTW